MDHIHQALSWLAEHALMVLDRLFQYDPHQRF